MYYFQSEQNPGLVIPIHSSETRYCTFAAAKKMPTGTDCRAAFECPMLPYSTLG